MKKNFNKRNLIIGILILLLLTLSGVIIFNGIGKVSLKGQNGKGELAKAMTYGELTSDDEKTQSDFVKFSAFYLRDLDGDGYAERVKGSCREIGQSDTLYMSLSVLAEGTFKNGKITFENNNMYFQTALVEDETIKGNYISDNTTSIDLKDVIVGTQKLIFGSVRSGIYNGNSNNKTLAIGTDTTKYSAINRVTITGRHVADDGTETEISKTVELPMDWYSKPIAEIPQTYAGEEKNIYQDYDTASIVDRENNIINIEFKVVTQEIANTLNLSKVHLEGIIPEFNGYAPISAEIKGTNVTYTYNVDTRKFTAERVAELNQSNVVITQAYSGSYQGKRYNEFFVEVQYPLEAYENLGKETINLNIPVKAYYEGYNNPNDEFDNLVRSNLAEEIMTIIYKFGGGDTIGFDMRIGRYVPAPYHAWVVSKETPARIYQYRADGIDYTYTNDLYDVAWYVGRGADSTIAAVKIAEPKDKYSDEFVDADGAYITMDPYITNKGIYIVSGNSLLGKDGYIDVFNDETNELIHRFTAKDWNLYTEENPYMYETPVKHVRIETSHTRTNSNLEIHNIKEINNELLTNTFSQEEFERLRLIFSNLEGFIKYTPEEEYRSIKKDNQRANYDVKQSLVNLVSINPDIYSTQETKENAKIIINTQTLTYNTVGWQNGIFLLKFPSDIMTLEINDIKISNSNVRILGYGLEKINDEYHLKILTENEGYETYNIEVDCDITPDPRNLTAKKDLELYSMNETAEFYRSKSNDKYDIDSDGDTGEYVGRNIKAIQFIGPTSLITMETASEYNEAGDELETSISPQIAVIDKLQSNKTAKISASLLNNYSGKISGIKLVGKIPFEGNTFQLTQKDLGSTFTATMTGPIIIPEDLKEYADVYYSENEMVTKDESELTNNWKKAEEIEDFSKVRTYMIDLNDYVMELGEERVCTYEIQIPSDIEYNDVAYSTHAVYFYLETDQGKYKDETETNKLGFMVAKKYDLEINKTKFGRDTKIKNAVFEILEEETGNRRVAVTDSNGMFLLKDLYVERTYTIKEIKAPNDYVIDNQEIRIVAKVDDDGEISVTKLSGTIKDEITIRNGDTKKIVTVNLENKPKFTMILNKFVEGTSDKVQGAKFRVTGKGLPSAGRLSSTNSQGQITISGLYPGETYTLVEEYAKGYEYSDEPIVFRTVWDGVDLKPEVIAGSFKETPIIDNDQEKQPILQVSLDNKKLREYSFELTKYEKDSDKVLNGAKFSITGKWIDDEISIDENGKLTIPVLYENIEYTVIETFAPQGYLLENKAIKFVGTFDENERLIIKVIEGALIEEKIKNSTDSTFGEIQNNLGTQITGMEAKVLEGENGIKVFATALENEPLFKLIKTDGITQELMPNVKFAIKKINEDRTEVDAVDTKGNLIGEEYIINGIKYRVIETDANGEIAVDLPEGAYKAIEVESLEGYVLEEDIDKRSYEFAIGASRPAEKDIIEENNVIIAEEGIITYQDINKTMDGGYIVLAGVHGKYTIPGEETVTGQPLEITDGIGNVRSDSGAFTVIKYNSNELIEWATVVNQGTLYRMKIEESIYGEFYAISSNAILKFDSEGNLIWRKFSGSFNEYDVIATKDGGCVFVGNGGNVNINANDSATGEAISEKNKNGTRAGIIVKVNRDGLVEWVDVAEAGNAYNQIFETESSEIIVIGEMGACTIPADETASGEEIVVDSSKFLIKYNSDGKIIDVMEDGSTTEGVKLAKTSDGGFIITHREKLRKFNKDIELEWEKSFSQVITHKRIIEVSDGYLDFGSYTGEFNLRADQTVNNQAITFKTKGTTGVIYKYNHSGLVEWVRFADGIGSEVINSGIEFSTGNVIAVGTSDAPSILKSEDGLGTDEFFGATKFNIDLNGNVSNVKNKTGAVLEYSSLVESNDNGNIIVGKLKGHLIIPADLTESGNEIELKSSGLYDAFIAKINAEQKFVWAMSLGNDKENTLADINKNGDNYIIVGTTIGALTISADQTKDNQDIVFTNTGTNGLLLEIDEDGKIINAKISENNGVYFYAISKVQNGKYYIGAKMNKTITFDGITMTNNNLNNDQIVIQMNDQNNAENIVDLYYNGDQIYEIDILEDDSVVAGGTVSTGTYTIPGTATIFGDKTFGHTLANPDGIIVRITPDMLVSYLKDIQPVDGASWDSVQDVKATDDGGYVVMWNGYSAQGVSFTEDETASGEPMSYSKGWCSYIIKFNNENKVESMTYRSQDTRDILVTQDGYITSNYSKGDGKFTLYNKRFELEGMITFDGEILEMVQNESGEFIVVGYKNITDSFAQEIIRFSEKIIAAEIPSQQVVEVKNYKKQFDITTKVKEQADGTKGGTISGEGMTPYEKVEYGLNSVNEIKIVPDEGYEILKITVNDMEIPFEVEADGTAILPLFEDVKEHKHVVVEFSNTVSEIKVHHYKDGTTESVAESETKRGLIGENYTTAPKMDLENYEVIVEKIPSNASGKYTTEVQEVIYYYKERPATLTVHHYLEGTLEELSATIVKEYQKGDSYVTTEATDIDEKYELILKPANAEGTIEEDTEVNYYYRVKVYEIRTKVDGEGGDISGSKANPYEEVEHGKDSQKEIKAVPNVGYKVSKITVNGEEITYTEKTDRTVELEKFINVKEDKEVIVTFERLTGNVKVNHYIEGTTEKIPLKDGTVIETEHKIGYIGEIYATKESEEIPEYYELVGTTEKTSGTYEEDEQEVIYYYQLKDYGYTIEYYYDGTKDDSKTETGTATYGTTINEYQDKVIDGYVLEKVEGKPITITTIPEDNIMKIFYIRRSDLSYTVKYLEQGTNEELAPNKVVENQVFATSIEEQAIAIDGYDKVNPTEQSITITTGVNEIIFYYTKRTDLTYRVEYYFNGTIDNTLTDTFTATYLDVIDTYTDKVKVGYKYESDTAPITIGTGDNVIKVYYVIDSSQKKEIKYSISYYKDNVMEKNSLWVHARVHVLASEEMEVLKEYVYMYDKFPGYRWDHTNPEVVPDYVQNGDRIHVYYVRDNFEYRIEYYYDGIKDDSKTEIGTALFESQIDTYPDKVIDGYVFEKVEGNPITIGVDETQNVMKVYYSKRNDLSYTVKYLEQGTNEELAPSKVINNQVFGDIVTENAIDIEGYNKVEPTEQNITITTGNNETIFYYTKRTDLTYRVEYYFNGTIDNTLTDTFTATYLDVIDTYTDKVKVGYKFESDTAPITIGVGENVIKVYYITDNTQEKELKYTVEYYKEGVLSETEEFTEVKQLLESDTLTVQKDRINTTNKYDGYKFVGTDPETIPDIIENNGVIKVYYEKDNFEYRIEYYYDAVIDNSKTEVGTAVFESKIDTYPDKVIDGYVFEKVEGNPITITSNPDNNVMKVYYIKRTDLSYNVKYLEQGTNEELAPSKVINNQVFGDIVTENAIDIEGYDKVEPTEQSITITTGTNETIFYYTKRTDLTYRVEYYFNGTIDNTLTDTFTATYLDVINTYTDKVKVGYKFESDTAPITIGTAENVIKVYYVTDETQAKELKYTVEYYKEGVLSEIEEFAEVKQLLESDILTVQKDRINTTNKYDGYKFVGTDPEIIPDIINNNGVIKVFYEKGEFAYKVEYYYDGIIDNSLTDTFVATYLEEITTYEDKVKNGYKYVSDTAPITIGTDENIIRVYYERKDTKVIVHYYEQNSINQVAEDIIIEGKVFDRYQTEAKDIDGYTLVGKTENTSGEMTEDTIEVIYHYAKNVVVTVKHIDKNTGEVLDEEIIPAKDGDIVETHSKDFPEYVLIETPRETTIVVDDEDVELIYIYVKISAGVIEKHIDVKTDEIISTTSYEGKEGDSYETEPKEFEGYDLVIERYPENAEGVMAGEVIEVKYYYIRKTSVKVEYIDANTGEEITETVIIEGHEDDRYETEEKEFDGYILIEEPENKEGTMKVEIKENHGQVETETEVIYKYVKEANVIVEYIDKDTGEKLAKDEYIEGYEGKEYKTETKEIEKYVLVEEPENKEGVMKVKKVYDPITGEETLNRTTKVVYEYEKKESKVIARYIYKLTGEILEEEVLTGKIDTPYETKEIEIEGYVFLRDECPENATGIFTEETIIVNYYYKKVSKVIVQYIDVITGEFVSEEIEVNGDRGDSYNTIPKDIPGYVLVEEKYPENADGTMDEEEEKVYYYYVREAKVEVKYVEKETGKELAEEVIIEGKEGDSYKTESKEIPYYKVDEIENGPEGKMKVTVTKDKETGEEIIDNVVEVVYKYVKQNFNINIEKTIAEVLVNGERQEIKNNKLVKLEIHRKKITNTEVIVKYQVKVTNEGEIAGTAKVTEIVPKDMYFNPVENSDWIEKDGLIYLETEELQPGESNVYEVILHWDGSKVIGTHTNNVEIILTDNEASYEDTDSADNDSEATIIIVPSTGIELVIEKIEITNIMNVSILMLYAILLIKVFKKSKK